MEHQTMTQDEFVTAYLAAGGQIKRRIEDLLSTPQDNTTEQTTGQRKGAKHGKH